jgi:hypothetical protein
MAAMPQPAIVRLEIGEHEPTFATLSKLCTGLGINFHIDITPGALSLSVQPSWATHDATGQRPYVAAEVAFLSTGPQRSASASCR